MLQKALRQFQTGISLFIFFTILTGIVYPGVVTLILQTFFPFQANGSLIEKQGKIIGSELIGQAFESPKYFWSRPSATTSYPYNAMNSGGSNLGPTNPELLIHVKARMDLLQKYAANKNQGIPIDLLTSSASGLDPDISPMAAFYQVPRIAKQRHIAESELIKLVESKIKNKTLHLFGEARVNVLQLNLALDQLK